MIAPLVNSYRRLVPGFEAPVYVSWARTNRSALIRVPAIRGGHTAATRIELRCPDPSCNPYLAFAAMLAAGHGRHREELPLPEPVEENLYHFTDDDLKRRNIPTLPATLGEAIHEMEKDDVMRDAPRRSRLRAADRGAAHRVGRVPPPRLALGARPLPGGVLGRQVFGFRFWVLGTCQSARPFSVGHMGGRHVAVGAGPWICWRAT